MMNKNFFCENHKCERGMKKNFLHCATCFKKFCSNACINTHLIEFHEKVSSKQLPSIGPKAKLSNKKEALTKSENNSGCLTTELVPELEIEESSENCSSLSDDTEKPKSLFIKEGKFLSEICNDPHYDFENFTLRRDQPLGKGAFGDVIVGINKLDGKKYAIKQINKKKITSPNCILKREQMNAEIDIHRRIIHENIIQLYSHYENDTHFYLINEYAHKGSLYNLIKKTKGMKEKLAFKYFIQAAAAIYFLHENELIHRDIKPENLLLDEWDNIKLCDFGWCVQIYDDEQRSTFCGTYEYMAPEVINEEFYDKSIDIWSLGILLYELLHGYSPFRAAKHSRIETHKEVLSNIVKYNYKFDKSISAECKDLIQKLLVPNMENRLKIGEIFSHPWVLSHEEELARKLHKNDNSLAKTTGPDFFKKKRKGIETVDIEEGSSKKLVKEDINCTIFQRKKGKEIKTMKSENKITDYLKKNTLSPVKKEDILDQTNHIVYTPKKNTLQSQNFVSEFVDLKSYDETLKKGVKGSNVIVFSDENEVINYTPSRLPKKKTDFDCDQGALSLLKDVGIKNQLNCNNSGKEIADTGENITIVYLDNELSPNKDENLCNEPNVIIDSSIKKQTRIDSRQKSRNKFTSEQQLINQKIKEDIEPGSIEQPMYKTMNNEECNEIHISRVKEEIPIDEKGVLDLVISKVKSNKKALKDGSFFDGLSFSRLDESINNSSIQYNKHISFSPQTTRKYQADAMIKKMLTVQCDSLSNLNNNTKLDEVCLKEEYESDTDSKKGDDRCVRVSETKSFRKSELFTPAKSSKFKSTCEQQHIKDIFEAEGKVKSSEIEQEVGIILKAKQSQESTLSCLENEKNKSSHNSNTTAHTHRTTKSNTLPGHLKHMESQNSLVSTSALTKESLKKRGKNKRVECIIEKNEASRCEIPFCSSNDKDGEKGFFSTVFDFFSRNFKCG